MMRSTLLTATLTCTLLVGCQSTRFSPALPRVSEYGAVRPQPTDGPLRSAKPADEPVLSAALPGPDSVDGARQEAHMFSSVVSQSLRVLATPLLATPDTAVNRMLQSQPKLPPDSFTTVVNVVGGMVVAGGIGYGSTAFTTPTYGQMWPALSRILVGVLLVIIGTTMLSFRGKNSRRRLLRQERKNR